MRGCISTQPGATAAVLAENQFNDPPAANLFFIATVAVTYVSGTRQRVLVSGSSALGDCSPARASRWSRLSSGCPSGSRGRGRAAQGASRRYWSIDRRRVRVLVG